MEKQRQKKKIKQNDKTNSDTSEYNKEDTFLFPPIPSFYPKGQGYWIMCSTAEYSNVLMLTQTIGNLL